MSRRVNVILDDKTFLSLKKLATVDRANLTDEMKQAIRFFFWARREIISRWVVGAINLDNPTYFKEPLIRWFIPERYP